MPITARSAGFPAYAFAFWLHLPGSHLPSCAVESSQDWKPTVTAPAFHPAESSTWRIASTICRVCVRDDPWSTMSEAIGTWGSPSPSYSMSVHDADVSGVTSGSDGAPSASGLPVPSPAPPPLVPSAAHRCEREDGGEERGSASIVVRFTTESLLSPD